MENRSIYATIVTLVKLQTFFFAIKKEITILNLAHIILRPTQL